MFSLVGPTKIKACKSLMFKQLESAFCLLSLPTKHDCGDVTMRAVMIWGLDRGKERVSECTTCE